MRGLSQMTSKPCSRGGEGVGIVGVVGSHDGDDVGTVGTVGFCFGAWWGRLNRHGRGEKPRSRPYCLAFSGLEERTPATSW